MLSVNNGVTSDILVCQLHPILDRRSWLWLFTLITFWLGYCYPKASIGSECNSMSSYGHISLSLYNTILHKLHCLMIGFGVWFKVLLITYKAPHGIRLDYLKYCLLPRTYSHREGMLHILFFKCCHPMGLRKCSFSVVAPFSGMIPHPIYDKA